MSVTRTSTTSVDTSVTTIENEDGESTTQMETLESTVAVSTGSADEDDADSAQLVIGGEATAVGEDTLAQGSISASVASDGTSTLVEGSAVFDADAQSSDGDIAFASADTFAEADVPGANIVVASDSSWSQSLDADGEASWSASSSTDIVALDIESSEPTYEPETTDESGAVDEPATTVDVEPSDDSSGLGGFDGNVAILTIDVEAYGEDTFIGVDATALTVEDQLSTVTGLVVIEVA